MSTVCHRPCAPMSPLVSSQLSSFLPHKLHSDLYLFNPSSNPLIFFAFLSFTLFLFPRFPSLLSHSLASTFILLYWSCVFPFPLKMPFSRPNALFLSSLLLSFLSLPIYCILIFFSCFLFTSLHCPLNVPYSLLPLPPSLYYAPCDFLLPFILLPSSPRFSYLTSYPLLLFSNFFFALPFKNS